MAHKRNTTMNNFNKSDQYDKDFINQNMMGPNAMIILEELLEQVPLKKNMRVLDLGCGNALTSIFLAKEKWNQDFLYPKSNWLLTTLFKIV